MNQNVEKYNKYIGKLVNIIYNNGNINLDELSPAIKKMKIQAVKNNFFLRFVFPDQAITLELRDDRLNISIVLKDKTTDKYCIGKVWVG